MKKIASVAVILIAASAQRTQKPPLHGRHWMAITGKPLAATAGAMIFQKGGNAVDDAVRYKCEGPREAGLQIAVTWLFSWLSFSSSAFRPLPFSSEQLF
jgi:hypothetical protein